jgi:hypothetical protein
LNYSIDVQGVNATITLSSITSDFGNELYQILPQLTTGQDITTQFTTTTNAFQSTAYQLSDLDAETTYQIQSLITHNGINSNIVGPSFTTGIATTDPITNNITQSPYFNHTYTPTNVISLGRGDSISRTRVTIYLEVDISQTGGAPNGWLAEMGGGGYGSGLTMKRVNNRLEIAFFSESSDFFFKLEHDIEDYSQNQTGDRTIIELSATTRSGDDLKAHMWINGEYVALHDHGNVHNYITGGGGNSFIGGSQHSPANPNPHDFGSGSSHYFNKNIYVFKLWKDTYIKPDGTYFVGQ